MQEADCVIDALKTRMKEDTENAEYETGMIDELQGKICEMENMDKDIQDERQLREWRSDVKWHESNRKSYLERIEAKRALILIIEDNV